MILSKHRNRFAGIKESAKVNIEILDYVAEHIKEGITTQEIDHWVADITARAGAVAAPLNYEGFPKSVCTSIMSRCAMEFPQTILC